jgi:hypothetical protein
VTEYHIHSVSTNYDKRATALQIVVGKARRIEPVPLTQKQALQLARDLVSSVLSLEGR